MAAQVVIVGAGFGGLYAARELCGAPVDVTIVDRKNHHCFQPLLYQVATAALSPGEIAQPVRTILAGCHNTVVRLGEVVGIDAGRRVVRLADGELPYDHLILAAGARHAYFGKDEWARLAPGLKTIEDALAIRNRLLAAFERAEHEIAFKRRDALTTFVVVGGGPTGVELAGAFAEIARQALRGEFRHVDPALARIVLLEAGPRLLPAFDPELGEAARRSLERLGVEVRLGAAVTELGEGWVRAGADRIEAGNIVWAAGVAASPLGGSLGAPTDKAGRVRVTPELTVPGRPEISVVGDMASLDGPDGKPLPGMAPVAIQMGRHAAQNILRVEKALPPLPFAFRGRGMMATIGRHAAVAQVGSLRLQGFVAWLAWLFIHLAFLIGFRNRALVLLEWSWAYITFDRGVRIITDTY